MSKDTTGTPCTSSNKCTKICGWSDAINLLQELINNSSTAAPDYTTALQNILTAVEALSTSNTTINATLSSQLTALGNVLTQLTAVNANLDSIGLLLGATNTAIANVNTTLTSIFATTNVTYNNCDGTTSQKAVKLEVQNTPHPDAVQKAKICQIPQTSAGITADFSGLGNIAYTNVTSLTTTTGPGGTPTAVAIPTGTREVYVKLTQGTRAIVRITLTDGSVIENQFDSSYIYTSSNEVHRIEADVQSLEIASANVQTIAGFINLNTAR